MTSSDMVSSVIRTLQINVSVLVYWMLKTVWSYIVFIKNYDQIEMPCFWSNFELSKNSIRYTCLKLKSKSGKMKAEVRFKITIPSNPNYNPLTERRKSESNISSGAKHGKNIKDGVWNSFNLETVAESYDEPDAEPYSQQKSNQSSPLVHPRVSDTRRHTIADLDQNVSLTDLPMVKRRDSIRRKPQ